MLIKKLAELQNELKVDDSDFAMRLGVSSFSWYNARMRRFPARRNHKIERYVRVSFPELAQYIGVPLPLNDPGLATYWKQDAALKVANLSNVRQLRRAESGACYFCGSTVALQEHHKDLQGERSESPNHDYDNLATLCTTCHNKLHRLIRSIEGRLRAAVSSPEIQIIRLRIHKNKQVTDLNRLIDMAIRNAAGEPMDSIGSDYNLSRQRVKQILDKAVM